MKQKELSLWLKAIVIVFFVFVLILCVFIIPSIGKDIKAQVPELAYMYPICLGFIWVSAVPFFIALLLVWKICTDIGENNAFTNNTSKRLRIIGTLAFSEVIYYMIGIMALLFLNWVIRACCWADA